MRDKTRKKITLFEIVLYAMLGALMFCSRILMAALPNIHLLAMLTVTYTVAFRTRALIPVYIYVFLEGLFSGFALWWIPYLYIWTVLWAIVMILPKHMPKKFACVVYPIVCCLHGLCFGILYAPAQAILFGLDFKEMLVWISAGAVFDIIHGIGDLAAGFLVVPLSELLKKLIKKHTHT